MSSAPSNVRQLPITATSSTYATIYKPERPGYCLVLSQDCTARWRRRDKLDVLRDATTGDPVPVYGTEFRETGPAGSLDFFPVKAGDTIAYRVLGVLASDASASAETGLLTASGGTRAAVVQAWFVEQAPKRKALQSYRICSGGDEAAIAAGSSSGLIYPVGWARSVRVLLSDGSPAPSARVVLLAGGSTELARIEPIGNGAAIALHPTAAIRIDNMGSSALSAILVFSADEVTGQPAHVGDVIKEVSVSVPMTQTTEYIQITLPEGYYEVEAFTAGRTTAGGTPATSLSMYVAGGQQATAAGLAGALWRYVADAGLAGGGSMADLFRSGSYTTAGGTVRERAFVATAAGKITLALVVNNAGDTYKVRALFRRVGQLNSTATSGTVTP